MQRTGGAILLTASTLAFAYASAWLLLTVSVCGRRCFTQSRKRQCILLL